MKPEDLKSIQQRGWTIVAVDREGCTVKCPTRGCQMRARFKKDGAVPNRDVPTYSGDQVVKSFDDVREAMKARRQELGLTIAEVEHISGISADYLAKFEKTEHLRRPGVGTMIDWATALGVDVVMRLGELPPVTLRWISDTRPKIEARRRRFGIERKRDLQLRTAGDPLEEQRARLMRQQEFIAQQIARVEDEMRAGDQGNLFGEFENE